MERECWRNTPSGSTRRHLKTKDDEFVLPKLPAPVLSRVAPTAAPAAAVPTSVFGRLDAIAGHRKPNRRHAIHDGASPRSSGHRHTRNGRGGRESSGFCERTCGSVGTVGGSGTGSGATSASTQGGVEGERRQAEGSAHEKQSQSRGEHADGS